MYTSASTAVAPAVRLNACWPSSASPFKTDTCPSESWLAGGTVQVFSSSVPTTPGETTLAGLPAAIVNDSVTGASGGGGGEGFTPVTVLLNTWMSPTWTSVFVLPCGWSAQNRMNDASVGVGNVKVL